MNKLLCGRVLAVCVGAGVNGVVNADVLADDLGVNDLTHEKTMVAPAAGGTQSGGNGTSKLLSNSTDWTPRTGLR